MSGQVVAEPPTLLSVNIQSAIDSYVPAQAGPTLADHIAKELLAWFTRDPCRGVARGNARDGGVAVLSGEGGGPQVLSFAPLTDEVLNANARETRAASPCACGEEAGAEGAKELNWPEKLNIVLGGSGVLAQLVAMRVTIWESGDWTLFIGFRTWARVRIKIDVSLCDRNYRGLCAISSQWKCLESTSGHVDCLVFGSSSRCISQSFERIAKGLRSTEGWGPLSRPCDS